MRFTRFLTIYCVIAVILLLSLSAGLIFNYVVSKMQALEDRLSVLEFEHKKAMILLENKVTKEKVIVVIPKKESINNDNVIDIENENSAELAGEQPDLKQGS